jgi:hypothetical protein
MDHGIHGMQEKQKCNFLLSAPGENHGNETERFNHGIRGIHGIEDLTEGKAFLIFRGLSFLVLRRSLDPGPGAA